MSRRDTIKIGDIREIARKAGATIMAHLSPDMKIERKADDSDLLIADREAHKLICRELKARYPDIPILSEEGTDEERLAAQKSPIKWIVDPLDGTNKAIKYINGDKSFDQFGPLIALVENDIPILGVSFFPAKADGKGILYYTGDDGRAYKQVGANAPKSMQVSQPPLKSGQLRAAFNPHYAAHAKIAGRDYVKVESMGGERVCLVADGKADVADMNAYDLGGHPYKQWDLAASHAILRAAGGEMVSSETGQPLTYSDENSAVAGAYAGGIQMLNFLGLANLPFKGHRL